VAFRRGFKSEANALALEVRQELGLNPFDAINPRLLADHLAIPVLNLSDFADDEPAMFKTLHDIESKSFSAVTVFRGSSRAIVHNDGHGNGRQASNICHECAHGLLLHAPTAALDDRGCRLWDQSVEDEAEFLSGALLLPEPAVLRIVRSGEPKGEAAQRLGISQEMVQYRVNITGAVRRSGKRWPR
jgi:hypothetical protein